MFITKDTKILIHEFLELKKLLISKLYNSKNNLTHAISKENIDLITFFTT